MNINKLCNLFHYTPDFLAEVMKLPVSKINAWLKDEEKPELKYLRELAILFGTSVYHLQNSEENITTTIYESWDDMNVNGFWGHIGLVINQSNYTKWYPISTLEYANISSRLLSDSKYLTIETLNNHFILINKDAIKIIKTLDDASDQKDDWEIDWDEYQGLGCEEIYNLIHEYFLLSEIDDEEFIENTTCNTKKIINKIIKEYNLTFNNYQELIYDSYIHHTDGKKTKIKISEEHIFDVLFQLELKNKYLEITDDYDDEVFFNTNKIEMIDIPLFLYHKSLLEMENHIE